MILQTRLTVIPLVMLCLAGAADASEDSPAPHWIWSPPRGEKERVGPATHRFERLFQSPAAVQATLRLAADFCRATVELNGERVLCVEPFGPTVQLDATAYMRPGENQLVLLADRSCGPSAVALSLQIETKDKQRVQIVSDRSWTALNGGAKAPVDELGVVRSELWGIGRRDATINAFENYEQWRIAAASEEHLPEILLPPGYQATCLRQATESEGSWISMAFDPQGRLTVSREDKGLLRMTFNPAREAVDRVETINDDLQECRGLLYAYEALYANANNSKGLYRLRDTDGDDRFDEVRLLREFPGRVGHGRNDLALGADGLIYSMHGDSVELPTREVGDLTSPLRDARRGKATSEGYLIRTDREGRQWEIVCSGLRNPYGIGVHLDGELFTYDADAEFDMGTPWYRPTRIVHLRSGADFGWRGVTGQWPPYYADHPDNALPTLDIGRGSPTALVSGSTSRFPPPYRNALFVLDWSYGRMLAVHLAQRGAGYRAFAETFLQGKPLNLTDVTFGPDGAMYVITGGRKTQSALYRITFSGPSSDLPGPGRHEQDCLAHSAAARATRSRLESYHRAAGAAHLEEAWPYLDDSDPAIRYAAQIAVEHLPAESWRERALGESNLTRALTLLVALLRKADPGAVAEIVDRLLVLPAKDLDLHQQRLLLHAYTLAQQQDAAVLAARRRQLIEQLQMLPVDGASHFGPAGGGDVRHIQAHLVSALGAPRIVDTVIEKLLHSVRQEDRLQALLVLRNVRDGWSHDARREYLAELNGIGQYVAGEGMPKFQAHLREEFVATLTETERSALLELLNAGDHVTIDPLPPPRPAIKKWSIEDFAAMLRSNTSADHKRGAVVFRDALCSRCHRVGARGPSVGPDLSFVGRRFSRRDILESILSPSEVVAEHYRNVQVVTKDGRVVMGRVLVEGDFRSETLRIAQDPLRPAVITELNKRDVDEYRFSDVSPMPSGLLDGFQPGEILDLLAYLQLGASQ